MLHGIDAARSKLMTVVAVILPALPWVALVALGGCKRDDRRIEAPDNPTPLPDPAKRISTDRGPSRDASDLNR